MGHMSNDVAELDNNQDHVVMRHKEERPIRIYDDSWDRQSIREAIASCITCLMWINIPRTLPLLFSLGDSSTILHSTCSMQWTLEHLRCVHMRAIGQMVSIQPNFSKKENTIAGLASHAP